MSGTNVEHTAEILGVIERLACPDNPGDPGLALVRIRELLAAVDARPGACPDWCVECYTTRHGARNHASYPRAVIGASVEDDTPVTVSTWVELRTLGDEQDLVGVIERLPIDVELSLCQLRELIGHLRAVAKLIEASEASSTAGARSSGAASTASALSPAA